MPSVTPLLAADPSRIGGYRLAGRLGWRPGEGSRSRSGTGGPAAFVVYLGHEPDGQPVTITLLQPVTAADPAARDRFMAEAEAARDVAPFCVARVLGAGFHGDFPYLVSEHVPGPSLAEAVQAQGPPAGEVLRAIAIGSVTGLAAIHQAGLVHGHFDAHRLVLGPEGPRVVHSGVTPPYGLATPAADVHAWAHAVLFAVTGNPDPEVMPARPRELRQLEPPLRELVSECLGRDPGTRPPAKVIVTRLLGHAQPPTGVIAAGSRAAAPARAAARVPRAGEERANRRPARPRRSRRAAAAGIALAVIGAAVTITAMVALVHLRAGDSGPAPRPSRLHQAGTPPSTTTPAPTAGQSVAGVRIPGWLSGTWSGLAKQALPTLTIATQVRLSAGATTGTVAYPSLHCAGVLRLTRQAGGRFVFSQGIVLGQRTCGQGTVTLTRRGAQLRFAFSPAVPGGPLLHGTLSRQ